MQIKDIQNYDDIIDIIYDNENLIERNYNSKKDQIVLHKELLIHLLHFLNKEEYKEIDKKELIKLVVKDVLELSGGDLVLIKKEYIFVKLYDEKKRKKVAQSEENTVASRYNGIDEEELKSFYKEYFSPEEVKALFQDIADIIVQKYFLDNHISHDAYEKDIFKIIQKLIIEDLSQDFECSLEFYKGFSGYIFRKNFKEVFYHIAHLLLKEVAFSNQNIVDFLKYYSLNILVIEGVKYKIPELTSDDGLRWHIVSIVAMAKTYIKVQEYIIDKDKTLKQLNKEIQSLYIGGISPIEYNTEIFKKFQKLDVLIGKNIKRIEHTRDALDLYSGDDKVYLEEELDELTKERLLLKDKKSQLQAKKVKQMGIAKYEGLLNKVEIVQRESKSHHKILKQNQDSFESIKSAIVNALISKKKVI